MATEPRIYEEIIDYLRECDNQELLDIYNKIFDKNLDYDDVKWED